MGELHLEIIKERIIREYKIDVELGPLQIAYREALVGSGKHTLAADRKIGGARQQVKVTMSAKNVRGVAADKVLRSVGTLVLFLKEYTNLTSGNNRTAYFFLHLIVVILNGMHFVIVSFSFIHVVFYPLSP